MSNPILLGTGTTAKSKPLAGTATNILPVWNNSTLTWAAVPVTGDVTLTSAGAFKVTAVQNIAWSTTPPTNGQVPTYNASGDVVSWATPSGGGGGGSPGGTGLTYFLNYSVSGASPTPGTFGPWKQMSLSPTTSAYTTVTVSAPQGSYANLADFVTDIGNPGATTTPPGFWDVNIYADFTGNQNDVAMQAIVYKWDGTTLSSPLATSEPVTLNNPGAPNLVTVSFFLPATTLTATERIAIRILVTSTTGGAHNVTGYFEGEYYSHVHTSLGAPGGTGLLKVVNGIVQAPAANLVAADIATTSGGLQSDLQVFSGTTSSAAAVRTLTGGTGVTITQGSSTITVAIGQSVAMGASPTFAGLTLTSFSGLIRATGGSLAGGATVALGSEVTGILPIANGGTGAGTGTDVLANRVFASPDGLSGQPSFRALVAGDIPSLSALYLPIAGGTLTGKLITATPASPGNAGLNLPHGVAPGTLVNGDIWTTTTGLFVRINGGTQQFAALNQNNVFTHQSGSYSTGTTSGTVNLASGATISGQTKTVNIGTGGLSGSTTTITIGATAGTSTTTLNGALTLAALTGYVKANGASTATASATIPTSDLSGSIALGSQVSGTLPIANGGTNNGSLVVTQGYVYYGDGTKLVGLAPGTSGQFLQTQGAGANPQWALTPYDFSSRFIGTPATSTILAEWVADRSVTLATSGWQFWCVTRPTTTTTNLLVKVNGTLIATFQFTTTATLTNGRYAGVLSGSITATTLAAGDFIRVETDTTVDAGFATPIFTMKGSA